MDGNLKETHRYDDIIDLPHHVSDRHPRMPISDRAAQFAPFQALSGFGDTIEETARVTEEWIELDDDQKTELDLKLRMLRELLTQRPEVSVVYFVPDVRKAGGAYTTVTGRIIKMDGVSRVIVMEDGVEILIDDIFGIEGEMFLGLENSVL
ncbi:MAG: YolD-like family protein [Oscillospiraceae bacterium]|nr:YolD-like family protein [Oscillospiraceae bacterium]